MARTTKAEARAGALVKEAIQATKALAKRIKAWKKKNPGKDPSKHNDDFQGYTFFSEAENISTMLDDGKLYARKAPKKYSEAVDRLWDIWGLLE